jgi:hypothetical protein
MEIVEFEKNRVKGDDNSEKPTSLGKIITLKFMDEEEVNEFEETESLLFDLKGPCKEYYNMKKYEEEIINVNSDMQEKRSNFFFKK